MMLLATSPSSLGWTWRSTSVPRARHREATSERYVSASGTPLRCRSPCTLTGAARSNTWSRVSPAPRCVARDTAAGRTHSARRDPSSGTSRRLKVTESSGGIAALGCGTVEPGTGTRFGARGRGPLPLPPVEHLIYQVTIQRDDEEGHGDGGGRGEPSVGEGTHEVTSACEEHEGHQGERKAEAQHHLTDHEGPCRVKAPGHRRNGRGHGDQPAHPDGDLPVEEPLHDHLARHRAHGGRGQAGGEQRDRE